MEFKSWLAKNKWLAAFIVACVLLIAAVIGVIIVSLQGGDEAPDYVEGSETGLYYYDTAEGEYVLSLHGGNKFTVNGPGYNKSGEYTVNGTTISLDFFRDEDGTAEATIENGVLTFTKDGVSTKYLPKVEYTVTFNTNGGSAVGNASVVNGKTADKPADPTREGYVFLGWYADEALKTPYAFSSTPVKANVTVYAKWAEKSAGAKEYTVDFDLGYEAEAPAAVTTVGGKLVFGADYEAPTREGYTFVGWFVSMTEDADKLSYEANDGTQMYADTTLFAVWAEDGAAVAAPAVSVSAKSVSWNQGANGTNYSVKITDANGAVIFEGTVGGTTKAFDFTAEAAGEYKVEVTATKGDATATAVRYYLNKALDRVAEFSVVDGKVLVFGAVAGAEKYYITVDCANPEHNHKNINNGLSTVYNFANCSMKEGGITFVVTATAEGYASSVSETYVYE
jgi:uncharacterized repeat protein (TIGR02543 family)